MQKSRPLSWLTHPFKRMVLICLSVCWVAMPLHAQQASKGKPAPAKRAKAKADPFAKLPPLRATGKEVFFRFRPGPKPPGQVGTHKKLPFPPKTKRSGKAPKVKKQALRVIFARPKGKVKQIGALSVTFNQPMVALSSLGVIKGNKPPIQVTPQPPGRFRWLGTDTISFEAKGRLPFATHYVVRVPKGTRSVLGNELEKEFSFTITTPRLKLVQRYPGSYRKERPDTWIALKFNQNIDQKTVFAALRVKGPGGEIPVALVPTSKWNAHRRLKFGKWDKKRSLVVRPLKRLPKSSSFWVELAPGVPGVGPLKTKKPISFKFGTYGPMKVVANRCSSRRRMLMGLMIRCYPYTQIWFRFSNRIGPNKWSKKVVLSKKLKGVRYNAYGNYLYISRTGGWPPGGDVEIKLLPGVKDIHGQTTKKGYMFRAQFLDAGSMLTHSQGSTLVVERYQPQTLTLKLRNIRTLRTRIARITPGNYHKYHKIIRSISYRKYRIDDPLDGLKTIYDKEQSLTYKKNKIVDHKVALKGIFKKRTGAVVIIFSSPELNAGNSWRSPHFGMLIQATDIGLTSRYDYTHIPLMATSFRTGKPIKKGSVALYTSGNNKPMWKGKTNAKGYVVLPGPSRTKLLGPTVVTVTKGSDRAILLLTGGGAGGYTYGYSRYSRIPKPYTTRSYVFTERSPYKPGETVHITGIFRRQKRRPLGGVVGMKNNRTIYYTIRTPRWRTIKKGEVKLGKGGIFHLDIKLKPDADLGNYRVRGYMKHKGRNVHYFYHSFQVQAYRVPEYKVSVSTGKGPFFLGQKQARATVTGRYTFGAPMLNAKVRWNVRRTVGTYRPPNQPPGFQFGRARPWWGGWRYRRGRYRYRRSSGTRIAVGTGKLNKQGQLVLKIPLKKGNLKQPGRFVVEAQVYDKNRQSIAGRTTILAHLSSLYIGMRSSKPVLKAKEKARIKFVAVSIDGKRQKGVTIKLDVLQSRTTRKAKKRNGAWTFTYKTKEVRVTGCQVQSGVAIVSCGIRVPAAGSYILRATAKDAQGRQTTTQMNVYAYGDTFVRWKSNKANKLELIPDRKSYKPGQIARILVKSPFRQARGIVTIERNGIAEHRSVWLKGSAQTIKIKIKREYIPGFQVAVSVARGRLSLKELGVKDKSASDLGRPSYAFGSKKLNVSMTSKEIRVKLTPSQETIRPGGKLKLTMKLTDYKGRPVKGLATIALVDEGVLSLLGFQTPAPLKRFHTMRAPWTALEDMRRLLLRQKKPLSKYALRRSRIRPTKTVALADAASGSSLKKESKRRGRVAFAQRAAPAPRIAAKSAPGGGQRGPSFSVRTKFATTAYYKATVQTNSKGIAVLPITMPDNLTTFRIMAVVVDLQQADRFGHGEGRVVVRKPLLLRPALPRFANVGDSFEAAVVINNETGKTGRAQVLIRGVNIELPGKTRASVEIPAGEAREVRFRARVNKSGAAKVQFAAVLNGETDAVVKELPILVPATAEAFATYGTTTGSVAQPIIAPKKALPQFGGLKISLSSTALTGLEDAVRYLVEYPHECNEQAASRLLPIFSLNKILPAFKIGKVSDVGKMNAFAKRGVEKLTKRQRGDGGWGYWANSRYSYTWLSVYVLYTLRRAQEAGYKVPKNVLSRAERFLRYRLKYSPLLWERDNYNLRAMVVWVLSETSKGLSNEIDDIYNNRKKLALFTKAWLMVAIHRHAPKDKRVARLLQELNNSATQLPGRVHFAERTSESLRLLMHSNDRSDAIILRALLEVRPKHALIPKVVRGLMKARIRGRWSSTQSNAFAMVALARYFAVYEKVVPNFTVANWLGQGYLGSTKMQGRSMTIVDQKVPMSYLLKQKKQQNLVLSKKGKGRLYYRIGVRYAPSDFKLKPADQGFIINRTYEPISDKGDVSQDKDGRWKFKAGSYVRVRLSIKVPSYRYFVAVIDPLPAGLEAVNLQLKTSASSRLRNQQTRSFRKSYSWYSFFAFNHSEKRDSMVVLYANRLPAGLYTYTYIARATTIGSFIVPPTRAEEMYSPEIFGRTASMFADVVK